MPRVPRKIAPPELSSTRTNKDWAMVFLGTIIILLFLAIGFLTVSENGQSATRKIRGPVKDPTGAISMERGAVSSRLDEGCGKSLLASSG